MPRLRALVDESGIRAHQDTLDRLLKGNFADLSPEQKEQRVEEIIQVSAGTAVGMAAVPIPFLDLPVLIAMVGAIGRVYGLNQKDNKLWMQVLGALGGGAALRQVLRMVPFGNQLYLSQIYGATWALGKTAAMFCQRNAAPTAGQLKRIFEETLRRKAQEHQKRNGGSPAAAAPSVASSAAAARPSPEARLRQLAALWEKNLISQAEYDLKRAEILAQL